MNQEMWLKSSDGKIANAKRTTLPLPNLEPIPVVLRTVEMTEVDKQNRNVHTVPQACNWQAHEQPAEMRDKSPGLWPLCPAKPWRSS